MQKEQVLQSELVNLFTDSFFLEFHMEVMCAQTEPTEEAVEEQPATEDNGKEEPTAAQVVEEQLVDLYLEGELEIEDMLYHTEHTISATTYQPGCRGIYTRPTFEQAVQRHSKGEAIDPVWEFWFNSPVPTTKNGDEEPICNNTTLVHRNPKLIRYKSNLTPNCRLAQ